MKKRIGIGLIILLVVALVAIPEASATNTIKSTLLTKYSLPTNSPLNTCDTCHIPGDTSSWNSYGTALQAQINGGATATQGMTNIEPLDSDGDGFTNLQELTAAPPTFPGDATSFPPTSDTTPPVITMLGSTPVSIVVGSVYVDAGATATDNVDGDLTSAIVTLNSVNTAVIGSYTVTYNVVDAAGNHAVEVVRTVNVVAAAVVGTGTVGIYRSGAFYLRNSNSAGSADLAFVYGIDGDTPLAGDWNGDGIDTVGIYRNGSFYLRNSNDAGNADMFFEYGTAGDTPIAGDWNGQ